MEQTTKAADVELFQQLLAEAHEDASSGWSCKSTFNEPDKGLGALNGSIHMKMMEGYPISWTRTEMTVPDCSLKVLNRYFEHVDEIYAKRAEISKAETLKRNDKNQVVQLYA